MNNVTAKTGMTLNDCLTWIRHQGFRVGKLAAAGDREAKILIVTYDALFRDKLNVSKQNELVNVVSAFIARELTVSEAIGLADKYGYKKERFDN